MKYYGGCWTWGLSDSIRHGHVTFAAVGKEKIIFFRRRSWSKSCRPPFLLVCQKCCWTRNSSLSTKRSARWPALLCSEVVGETACEFQSSEFRTPFSEFRVQSSEFRLLCLPSGSPSVLTFHYTVKWQRALSKSPLGTHRQSRYTFPSHSTCLFSSKRVYVEHIHMSFAALQHKLTYHQP